MKITWLGISDHSYCINNSEFSVVKNDCVNANDNGFACLMGEEISTSDKLNEELKEV